MKISKGLVIADPWIGCILKGEKAWEMRSTSCSHRGWFGLPRRDIDPKKLQAILRAIREKKALNIEYQSMARPKPILRWITPHAIGFDGFRWHARSY